MRQVRWASGTVAMAMALALCGVRPAAGDVISDQAAAIVIYPDVLVDRVDSEVLDTVIQLSNTSLDPVIVWCFYENANSHCTNSGEVCEDPSECCDSVTGCGVCLPGWNETDFHIRLTPRQPIGWLASEGLVDFPLDGVKRQGRGGSSNAGSRIPPVPEDPFNGALKCLVVDDTNRPLDQNVLKGEATITTRDTEYAVFDVSKHNAVGIKAQSGAVNDDNELVLGGDEAEYNGCPNVIILNHFFDFAINPVSDAEVFTRLILVPCTEDLLRQIPGGAVIQYLVYNEFEQRFSTSRPFDCKQDLYISDIDTTQPERSIFSAGVGGTLTGQTRLTAIGSGVVGLAEEVHEAQNPGTFFASFNVHMQGDREDADVITLP